MEKTGANTAWVAGQLARFAGVAERQVGYAGLKDRHAITRQWFSVWRGGETPDWEKFELPGVRILRHGKHRKKLRRGAHSGNEFDIILQNISILHEELNSRLEDLASHGVPNYFAEQRFGRDYGNIRLARELFAGKRLKRHQRSLALSAARSLLFNRVLDSRVRDGSWNALLDGDCASLNGSNSVFAVEEVDEELQRRCIEMDLHPSGPLWGKGELMTSGTVALLESSMADDDAAMRSGLERMTEMARRPLRVALRDMSWERMPDSLRLRFTLPRGSYATAVLREIAEYTDCSLSAK